MIRFIPMTAHLDNEACCAFLDLVADKFIEASDGTHTFESIAEVEEHPMRKRLRPLVPTGFFEDDGRLDVALATPLTTDDTALIDAPLAIEGKRVGSISGVKLTPEGTVLTLDLTDEGHRQMEGLLSDQRKGFSIGANLIKPHVG